MPETYDLADPGAGGSVYDFADAEKIVKQAVADALGWKATVHSTREEVDGLRRSTDALAASEAARKRQRFNDSTSLRGLIDRAAGTGQTTSQPTPLDSPIQMARTLGYGAGAKPIGYGFAPSAPTGGTYGFGDMEQRMRQAYAKSLTPAHPSGLSDATRAMLATRPGQGGTGPVGPTDRLAVPKMEPLDALAGKLAQREQMLLSGVYAHNVARGDMLAHQERQIGHRERRAELGVRYGQTVGGVAYGLERARPAMYGVAALTAAPLAMGRSGLEGSAQMNALNLELQLINREIASALVPALREVTSVLRWFREGLQSMTAGEQKWLGRILSAGAALGAGTGGLSAVGYTVGGIRQLGILGGGAATAAAATKAGSKLAGNIGSAAVNAGTSAAGQAAANRLMPGRYDPPRYRPPIKAEIAPPTPPPPGLLSRFLPGSLATAAGTIGTTGTVGSLSGGTVVGIGAAAVANQVSKGMAFGDIASGIKDRDLGKIGSGGLGLLAPGTMFTRMFAKSLTAKGDKESVTPGSPQYTESDDYYKKVALQASLTDTSTIGGGGKTSDEEGKNLLGSKELLERIAKAVEATADKTGGTPPPRRGG